MAALNETKRMLKTQHRSAAFRLVFAFRDASRVLLSGCARFSGAIRGALAARAQGDALDATR